MTRKFWLGVMLSSLVITIASAAFLYLRLNEQSTVEVPLEQIPKTTISNPGPKPMVETKTDLDNPGENEIEEEVKELIQEETVDDNEDEIISDRKRNILFTLFSSTAKKVSIVGDFNNWFREPLTRIGDKKWQLKLELIPGTYHYLYIVDNKRIKDPNNSKTTSDGKSILTVKPFTE